MNTFQPQVGKVGAKQRSKDAQALSKLGVVTMPKVDPRLQNMPKMKFKEDMPVYERKAVKNIAKSKREKEYKTLADFSTFCVCMF